MRSMTLEQLRAARNAGGVADVTLKGQGDIFSSDHYGQRCQCGASESAQQPTAPLRQSSGRIERIARPGHHHWPV